MLQTLTTISGRHANLENNKLFKDGNLAKTMDLLKKNAKDVIPMAHYAILLKITPFRFRDLLKIYPVVAQTIITEEITTYKKKLNEYNTAVNCFKWDVKMKMQINGEVVEQKVSRDKMYMYAKDWDEFTKRFNLNSITKRFEVWEELRESREFNQIENTDSMEIRRKIMNMLDKKAKIKEKRAEKDLSFRNEHLSLLDVEGEQTKKEKA